MWGSSIRNLLRLQPTLRRGRIANRVAVMLLLALASVLVLSVAVGFYRMVRV
jgi:hypothetical protein